MPYVIPISELLDEIPVDVLKLAKIPEWLKYLPQLFGLTKFDSYWDENYVIYEGYVHPVVPIATRYLDLSLGNWRLRLFGGQEGWPFTLWVNMDAGSSGGSLVEKHVPTSKKFLLHMHIPSVELFFDPNLLKPGRLHTEPHTYVAVDPGGPQPRITLPQVTLLFNSETGDWGFASFQSWEEAITKVEGFVLQTEMTPRYTVLDPLSLGLGLDRIVVDLSTTHSPAPVMRMPGYDASWQGVYLGELLLYFPTNAPRMSGAIRARDFVLGDDGVTGKFMAEFAKDYPISDGKIKIGTIEVTEAGTQKKLRAPGTLEPWEQANLESLEGLTEGDLPPYDLYCNAEKPSLDLKAPITGMTKSVNYEWRVDNQTVSTGAAKYVQGKPMQAEAHDLTVTQGLHKIELFVYEKMPVSSGSQRVTTLLVVKAEPQPLFTVSCLRATGWTEVEGQPLGQASSCLYLCGAAPYHVKIEKPGVIIPDQADASTLSYQWDITKVGEATPTGTYGDLAILAFELKDPGRYVVTLTVKVDNLELKRKLIIEVFDPLPDGTFNSYRLELLESRLDPQHKTPERVGIVPPIPTDGSEQVAAEARVWKLDQDHENKLLSGEISVFDVTGAGEAVKIPHFTPVSSELTLPQKHDLEKTAELVLVEVTRTQLNVERKEDQAAALVVLFQKDVPKLTAEGTRWIQALAKQIATQEWIKTVDIIGLTPPPDAHNAIWADTLIKTRLSTVEETLKLALGKWGFQNWQQGGRTLTVQKVPKPDAPQPDRISVHLAGKATEAKAQRRIYALHPRRGNPRVIPGPPALTTAPPLFRAGWFRRLRVEMDVQRNDILKGQIETVVDLYDLKLPVKDQKLTGVKRAENDTRGLMRMLLSITRDPATGRVRIETSGRADPRDKKGLFSLDAEKGSVKEFWKWTRAFMFALPPAAALTAGDTVTQLVAVGTAGALAGVLRALNFLDVSSLLVQGFRVVVEIDDDGSYKVLSTLDYDTKVKIQIPPKIGDRYFIDTGNTPLNVQYQDVGFFIGGAEGFGLHYKPEKGFAIDIKDEGILKLPDWAASLLTISRLRLGIGSPMRVDVGIRLKQNLGLFKISLLSVWLEIEPTEPPKVTPGLGPMDVSVDIPNVLRGRGFLAIDSDPFQVRGSLDLKLNQPDFRVEADLGIQQRDDFTAIFAALFAEFSPGVPLGPSGAGLFGVGGLFAMHFARKEDISGDAFHWYANQVPQANARSIQKWHVPDNAADVFAFGVGVVIGTLSDGGRAFNAKGMLILEFPGPRILLAVRANLLSQKPKLNEKRTGTILAVVDLDFQAGRFTIKLAVHYTIEKILELKVPAEVFFDMKKAGNYHIWLGRDKPADQRIKITVLNFLKGWGYLMIQGPPIENLAGKGVTLPGPAIALGFRAEFFWGSREANFYLEAYMEVHTGLGLSPIFFFGLAELGGHFHLFVAGVGVDARLQAQADQTNGFSMEGRVCGEVQLLFWKARGCLDFKLGPKPVLPPPEPVLDKLAFTHRVTTLPLTTLKPDPGSNEERREEITGVPVTVNWRGLRLSNADDIAWPNPVPIDSRPVLNFRTGMNGGSEPAGPFSLTANPPGAGDKPNAPQAIHWDQVSSRLKYRYDLVELRLFKVKGEKLEEVKLDADDERIPAAWLTGQTTKQQLSLALLDWKPAQHLIAQELTGEIEALEETMTAYFQRLCAPLARATAHLYTFDDQPLGPADVWRLLSKKDRQAPPVVVRPGECSDGRNALVQMGWETHERAQVVDALRASLPPKLANLNHFLKLPINDQPVQLDLEGLTNVRIFLATRAGATIAPPMAEDASGGQHQLRELSTLALPGQGEPFIVREFQLAEEASIYRVAIPSPTFPPVTPSPSSPDVVEQPVDLPPSIPRDHVYLLAIEGQVYEAYQERKEGGLIEQVQKKAQEKWNRWISQGEPENVLLEPDTKYVLKLGVNWTCKARKKKDETTDVIVTKKGQQVMALGFRTAAQPPVDLSTYVETTIPAAGGESHYYTEPLSILFGTSSIQHHVGQFEDRQLLIYAKSERSAASVGRMVAQSYRPARSDGEAEAKILAAMKKSKCLVLPTGDAHSIAQKLVGTLAAEFVPNTGYRATLVSVPEKDLGTAASLEQLEKQAQGRPAHYEWHFTTSRWPTFTAHIADFAGIVDLMLPDGPAPSFNAAKQKALLGNLAESPPEQRSDQLLEEVLYRHLRTEALPPSPEPVGYRIWQKTGTDQWKCLGLLLDSPEPLFRAGHALRPAQNRQRGPALQVGGVALRIVKREGDTRETLKYALLTNTQGTRTLVWSPGLEGELLDLEFVFTKPRLPEKKIDGLSVVEEKVTLTTYVLAKPGAYLEEN